MPIRLRLALLYTSILVVLILGFVGWFISSTSMHLVTETDETLATWAKVTGERVSGNSDFMGNNSWHNLPRADVFKLPGLHVQILTTEGNVAYCSENLGAQKLPMNGRALASANSGIGAYYTAYQNGESMRVFDLPVIDGTGKVKWIVQVGTSLSHVTSAVRVMKQLALAGTLTTLIIAGVLTFIATSRALKPVASLTSTARAIASAGEFRMRVAEPPSNKDELGQLALAFNEMLASLEMTNSSHRRFLADASHELRSPLTSLENNVSFMLRAKGAPEEAKEEALDDMATEIRRMSRLVSQLLYLARTESGTDMADFRGFDLSTLVSEEYRSFKALAEGREYTLTVEPDLKAFGDMEGIRRAIRVLMENALRYTPPEGSIRVTASKEGSDLLVSVEDTGIGITEVDRQRIFDEFFRSQEARKADPGGSGLGLPIAQRVAVMHGGGIDVISEPGKGSTFTLRLDGPGILDA